MGFLASLGWMEASSRLCVLNNKWPHNWPINATDNPDPMQVALHSKRLPSFSSGFGLNQLLREISDSAS